MVQENLQSNPDLADSEENQSIDMPLQGDVRVMFLCDTPLCCHV